MVVIKTKEEKNYKLIEIKIDNDLINFVSDKNGLYIIVNSKKNKIRITKENYYLYSLTNELYEAIKSSEPFLNSTNALDKKDYPLSIYELSESKDLFYEKAVMIYSEEGKIKESNGLKIKKLDEEFELIFNKALDKNILDDNLIYIKYKDSRYYPYNITLKNFFKKLFLYDYQIHIEELLYKEKVKKLIK